MNQLTAFEALELINESAERFVEIKSKTGWGQSFGKMPTDLNLIEFTKLCGMLRPSLHARLFMPYEMDASQNMMVLVFEPVNGLKIYIRCEYAPSLKPKINLINYN